MKGESFGRHFHEFPSQAEFRTWRALNPERGVADSPLTCPMALFLGDLGYRDVEIGKDRWTHSSPLPIWARRWTEQFDAAQPREESVT